MAAEDLNLCIYANSVEDYPEEKNNAHDYVQDEVAGRVEHVTDTIADIFIILVSRTLVTLCDSLVAAVLIRGIELREYHVPETYVITILKQSSRHLVSILQLKQARVVVHEYDEEIYETLNGNRDDGPEARYSIQVF